MGREQSLIGVPISLLNGTLFYFSSFPPAWYIATEKKTEYKVGINYPKMLLVDEFTWIKMMINL